MNKLTTIYVIRHAESKANTGDYTDAKSVAESPLTERGIKQANGLAKKLKNVHLDAIFSSDLARAKETADIIALERKLELMTSDRIRERSYHEHRFSPVFRGNEEAFIQTFQKGLKDLDEKGKMQFKLHPEMESAEDGAIRLLNFIREASVAYRGKKIAIVCHGNLMRSLLTHLGYAKYDHLPSGAIDNTGYFVLESDGIDFFVKEIYGINIQEGALRNF